MFRTLFRLVNCLSTLIVGILVIDEIMRRKLTDEISGKSLHDDETQILDNLINQYGEGLSVYHNEEYSGFLFFPPPLKGINVLVGNR